MPKVTGIIPCHNHQDWIENAVKSMASQKYVERIVVVNDGSTDDSCLKVLDLLENGKFTFAERGTFGENQIKKYCGKYYRNNSIALDLVDWDTNNKIHGPSLARNLGIQRALADKEKPSLLAFLDSDDIYAPDKVGKSVEVWEEFPNLIGAIYSDFETFGVNEHGESWVREQFKEPFDRERLIQECIVNCDSVVSVAAIEQIGLFDEDLRVCEDYDMWMRMSEQFTIIHIPEPLVQIRVGSHSATDTVNKELWNRCYQRVFDKAAFRSHAK